jgi:hypothetical protein
MSPKKDPFCGERKEKKGGRNKKALMIIKVFSRAALFRTVFLSRRCADVSHHIKKKARIHLWFA